jgi:hypothetical protein
LTFSITATSSSRSRRCFSVAFISSPAHALVAAFTNAHYVIRAIGYRSRTAAPKSQRLVEPHLRLLGLHAFIFF